MTSGCKGLALVKRDPRKRNKIVKNAGAKGSQRDGGAATIGDRDGAEGNQRP